jgi:hypothetical protein
MLARMTSETWQKDPEVTLFIERNGECFQYCLDYMRDGEVWLPLNAPKEGILLDLDYFGFEEVDTTKIHGGSSNLAAARHLVKCKKEHEQVLSTCMESVKAAETALKAAEATRRENVKAAKTTSTCEEVAYECFVRSSRGESLAMSLIHSSEPVLCESAKIAVANQAEFQDHLAKYGLALVHYDFVHYRNGIFGQHILTLKEREDTID